MTTTRRTKTAMTTTRRDKSRGGKGRDVSKAHIAATKRAGAMIFATVISFSGS